MAFGIGDSLSVRISAQTRNFENNIEDAEDTLRQLGNTAVVTSGKIATLSGASAFASASFQGWSATTLSVLLPALAALATTLVPLAATVGGLATAAASLGGAFGLVAGSGAAAFAQANDLEKVLKELRKEIIAIVAEFGKEFIPLIEDTIDALPDLTEDILDAVGPVDDFVEALRGFGEVAQREIPRLVSRLADLARRSLPAVIDAGQWLLRNGPNIFEGILRTTREVAPLLLQLGRTFADILPTINEVGTTVLEVLVPALDDFLGAIDKLLQGDIEGGLIDPIVGIVSDVVAFFNSDDGQKELDKVSTAIFSTAATALNNASSGDIKNVTNAVAKALISSIDTLANTLEETGLLASIITFVTRLLSAVTSELVRISGQEWFQEDIAVIGGNIGSALGDAIVDGVKEQLSTFNLTAAGSAFVVKNVAEATPDDGVVPDTGDVEPIPQNPTSSTGVGQPARMEVELNDELLNATIEDGAQTVIEERERRANRNTGGNTTP